MRVLHLSSWKDSLNDKRYGDYENPILQYMYAHDDIHNNYINYKPNYLVCTEK